MRVTCGEGRAFTAKSGGWDWVSTRSGKEGKRRECSSKRLQGRSFGKYRQSLRPSQARASGIIQVITNTKQTCRARSNETSRCAGRVQSLQQKGMMYRSGVTCSRDWVQCVVVRKWCPSCNAVGTVSHAISQQTCAARHRLVAHTSHPLVTRRAFANLPRVNADMRRLHSTNACFVYIANGAKRAVHARKNYFPNNFPSPLLTTVLSFPIAYHILFHLNLQNANSLQPSAPLSLAPFLPAHPLPPLSLCALLSFHSSPPAHLTLTYAPLCPLSFFLPPCPNPPPLRNKRRVKQLNMDDTTGFAAELEQAAVAGAEGTAWAIPEFSDAALSTTAPSSFPFDYSATKPEPTFLDLHPSPIPSSPLEQTSSLCSLESDEAFASTPPIHPSCLALGSPVSPGTNTSAKPIASTTRPIDDLSDLKGTTAARSRKMTEEERRVMLHKRRLRNRASAARSREKRSRTLNDLSTEVEELLKRAAALAEQAKHAMEETRRLNAKNVLLTKENELLKAELNI